MIYYVLAAALLVFGPSNVFMTRITFPEQKGWRFDVSAYIAAVLVIVCGYIFVLGCGQVWEQL